MKTLAKETLRWAVIVVASGLGIWLLVNMWWSAIEEWTGKETLPMFIFPVVITVPLFAVGYYCLRRQYRKIFLGVGVIGCGVLFVEGMLLPEQLGMFPFMERHVHGSPFDAVELPLVLLAFLGPIYAAAWFYRVCHRLAYPLPEGAKRPKTRATRWLVWLGVLCMILPTIVGMIVTFNQLAQSTPTVAEAKSFNDSIRWITGLTVIGSCLFFLGLVRRQPVADSAAAASVDATPPPEGDGQALTSPH